MQRVTPISRQELCSMPSFAITTPVAHDVSDTVGMEGLSDVVGTLKVLSENYGGEAGEEFCTFVAGLCNLREALEAYGNQGEHKESRKEDVMAIGWRVEHDLSQYVRWLCDRLLRVTDLS